MLVSVLTSVEPLRVQKLMKGWGEEAMAAMTAFFAHTKPGCDAAAYELMDAAHYGGRVSDSAISLFQEHGLVTRNGSVPDIIKAAIKKAVRQGYLMMHSGPGHPDLKPKNFSHLDYE